MSWLSSLFSSETIIETGAKGLYNGIDLAIFTEEERQIAHQKILDWKLEYYKATAPQNMSRRYIAIGILFMWCLLILGSCLLYLCGLEKQSEFLFSVLKEIILQPFNIILGFYFLAHITGKFGNK